MRKYRTIPYSGEHSSINWTKQFINLCPFCRVQSFFSPGKIKYRTRVPVTITMRYAKLTCIVFALIIFKSCGLTRLYFSISRIAQVDLPENNTERACCVLEDLFDAEIYQCNAGIEIASNSIIGNKRAKS